MVFSIQLVREIKSDPKKFAGLNPKQVYTRQIKEIKEQDYGIFHNLVVFET